MVWGKKHIQNSLEIFINSGIWSLYSYDNIIISASLIYACIIFRNILVNFLFAKLNYLDTKCNFIFFCWISIQFSS